MRRVGTEPVGFLMAGARLSTGSALAPPAIKMRQVNQAGPKNETVIAKPKAPRDGIKQKWDA